MKKRIISLVLVLALCLPFVTVPVGAVAALPAGGTVAVVNPIAVGALAGGVTTMFSELSETLIGDYAQERLEQVYNCLVSIIGYGQMPYWKLQSKVDILNSFAENPHQYLSFVHSIGVELGYWDDGFAVDNWSDLFVFYVTYRYSASRGWHIVDHPDYGWVIASGDEMFTFADSLGRFPYANDQEDIWRDLDAVTSENVVNPVTSYSLKNRLSVVQEMYPAITSKIVALTFDSGLEYQVIVGYDTDRESIWCDYEGKPYAVPLYDTQVGSGREYNDDTPGQPLVNGDVTVDIDPNFVVQMFPDGSFTWIDGFAYDASNTTYYVDASTSYDVDNNYYYNYEWHYTYHIDYTSITYIGETAEYNEVYEYYYDLPDGRSSADLTAEELQALNTQIDVLPYIRSADDTSIRALYHFDGDTRDSSYWSYVGNFDWVEGASITYMDAGAFNGALYLDENAHEFIVTLPSNLSSGDFTVQFRYYQSATVAPVFDSTLTIGGWPALGFNGESILDGTGAATFAPVSVGNWQEICLMRKDGVLYRFHNGVPISSPLSLTTFLSDTILFSFGSDQQTYKYFDELRVVSQAIYDTDGYTPTSVPYDTNLALVLPDSQLPVADAYWDIDSSGDNILAHYGLDDWTDLGGKAVSYLTADFLAASSSRPYRYFALYQNYWSIQSQESVNGGSGQYMPLGNQSYLTNPGFRFPCFNYFTSAMDSNSSGTILTNDFLPNYSTPYPLGQSSYYNDGFVVGYDGQGWRPYGGLISTLGTHNDGTSTMYGGLDFNSAYTLAVVFGSGDVRKLTFNLSSLTRDGQLSYTAMTYNDTVFGVCCTGYYDGRLNTYELFVMPRDPIDGASTDSIVYMELVVGNSSDLTAEYVESVVVMDRADLHTPSLAVRTDLEITGYQIGGVRPSLPTKGLVWALVENSRITSLQIYNGQAWEEVDGRIWTGSRWVPYYAYDVLLLKDMWDIVEADPTLNPIYTETGFWTWLQNAWKDMISRLDAILAAINNISGVPVDTCAHVYESKSPMSPTCTDSSHVVYTCSLCGDTYTETVAATGHDWLVTDIVDDSSTDYVFVDSLADCTDTSKKYVLPDGYIYEWYDAPFTLPDGYRQIEYIETTGTQYLDTGFTPNQDTRVVCDFSLTSTDGFQYIYGAWRGIERDNFSFRISLNRWQPIYNTEYGTFTSVPVDTNWHTADQNKNVFSFDGVVRDTRTYASFRPPVSLTFGAVHMPSGYQYGCAKFASAMIYDDGTLVRNLIPCVSSSGNIGMYDVVHGVFYGGSGTDPFISGPEVEMDVSRWVSTGHKYGDVPFSYKVLTCSKCGITTRDYGDGPEVEEEWKLIDLGVILMDGTWAIVKGVVRVGFGGLSAFANGVSNVSDFFNAYDSDTYGGVLDIMNVGSDVVWD